jgi:hypothetical protein
VEMLSKCKKPEPPSRRHKVPNVDLHGSIKFPQNFRQAHVTAITSDAFLGRPVIRIIRDCRSERGASILPPEVTGLVPVLRVPICETDGYEIRCSYVRAEHSVRVQCLRCGHVGVLTAGTLSRLAITPSTPLPRSSNGCAAVAAAVKVSWRRASLRTGRKEPRDVWAFHHQSQLGRNHRPL